MKKSQIALLVFSLLVTGLIFFQLSRNKKTNTKELKSEKSTLFVPVRTVVNSEHIISLTAHGQVTPYQQVIISAEVQGMLEKGSLDMKPGKKFKQGELLYRINGEEYESSFKARKYAYATAILNIMPDIELDFPSERDKWIGYINDLTNDGRLPWIPEFKSDKEYAFMLGRNVITEFYNLKNLETRLDKYAIKAPFTGTVTDVFMEPGSIANPGVQIVRIVKTNDYEVKVPVTLADLSFFKNESKTKFTDSDGNLIGYGSIERISDVVNQQTQSVDVYYTLTAEKDQIVYNGMFLNAQIDKEVKKNTFVVPRVSVKNNKIGSLGNDGKITNIDVTIVGYKPDSIFVSGLTDGTKILLEPIDKIDPKVIYKGVDR